MSDDRPARAGPATLLFDGRCVFCTRQSRRLLRLARPGSIVAADFNAPGVLDRFPAVSPEAASRAMQLVMVDGRVFSGFEAAVRALAMRRGLGWLLWVYRLPPVRWVCEAIYRWIARNRYRFGGTVPSCQTGACALPGARAGEGVTSSSASRR
jgi:predicted DCC family thiol-disulfide oxidoreductase YuxK